MCSMTALRAASKGVVDSRSNDWLGLIMECEPLEHLLLSTPSLGHKFQGQRLIEAGAAIRDFDKRAKHAASDT